MDRFAREARRLAAADDKAYAAECGLVRELLSSAAELGEAILKKRRAAGNIPYGEIKRLYNGICGERLPKIQKLSDTRKRHIKARFADGYTIEDFKRLFEITASAPFLCGENSRNWAASFDWLIEPNNFLKVIEGNYSSRSAVRSDEHSYDLSAFDDMALTHTPMLEG